MKRPVIVDLFNNIVAKVSAVLTDDFKQIDPNITGVHYDFGHPIEIINTLAEKDKTNTFVFQKYPLIALFQDFPENNNIVEDGLFEVVLHIVIVRSTDPNYRAKERYDKNFKPFLYPIYDQLMKEINNSGYFMTQGVDSIRHVKIDRLFWGSESLYGNKKNIFGDWVDAIEIKNLKLKVYKTC